MYVSNISYYRTSNNRHGVRYTINGKKAASFIPNELRLRLMSAHGREEREILRWWLNNGMIIAAKRSVADRKTAEAAQAAVEAAEIDSRDAQIVEATAPAASVIVPAAYRSAYRPAVDHALEDDGLWMPSCSEIY